ncbi:MAG TPA: hypothetical protein [Bacteriophage sp.]|nr:MAG TPA: hypothetical protein [Bacteriophage sp.]DAH42478.1 MAG TPA: hypothetical protein [Bacteriophage sp.]
MILLFPHQRMRFQKRRLLVRSTQRKNLTL